MTVTIVVGPPCAGKTTHAWQARGADDLVVDYDRLAGALGNAAPHGAEGPIRRAAYAARSAAIAVALSSDADAWILHTTPSAAQLERYREAGAAFVLIDPGEDECIARARAELRPEGTEDVIRAWYADPPALPEPSPSARHSAEPAANGDTMPGTTAFGIPQAFQSRKPEWIQIQKVTNVAGKPSTATIHLYDAIDPYWGISAQSFVDQLNELEVDEITLRVNSPGGSVYDGIAIANALRAHDAKVTAYVDGLAASIASVIITAADEVVMMPNSEIMIHEASALGYGDARDLTKTADRLEKIGQNIAGAYADRAGGKAEDWRAAMLEETWYSASEAVAAGLADRVVSSDRHADDAAKAKAAFDLSVYAHAGRSEAPDPRMPGGVHMRAEQLAAGSITSDMLPAGSITAGTLPAAAIPSPADLAKATKNSHTSIDVRATRPAEPDDQNTDTRKESTRMADYSTEVRNRLGLPAEGDIDDATFVEALERSTTQNTAPAAAAGTVVLDAEAHAALVAGAEDGRLARAEQDRTRRESLVNAAVNDGRIPPSRREHWLKNLKADEEGYAPVLANLEKGLIPLEPKGATGGVDEATDQGAALYNTLWSDTAEPNTKEA